MIAGNCAYELAQAGEYLAGYYPNLLGCTAVAFRAPGLGLVHVRNLDWDLEGMGRTSLVYELQGQDRDIISVSNPGMVGILSGMVPGKFSITLNWARPLFRPRFEFGPIFLIRHVLETAEDFDEAVEMLSHTKLSTPCFFMVVGVDDDEAVVIERTPSDHEQRWIEDGPLALTNHYVSPGFQHLNEGYCYRLHRVMA